MGARYPFVAVMALNFLLSTSVIGFGKSTEDSLYLMPVPSAVQQNAGRFRIDQKFRVLLAGYRNTPITDAVIRMLQRMRRKTGLPLAEIPASSMNPDGATLQIECRGAGDAVQSMNANEDYDLEVAQESIHLTADSPIGIMRGLETFLQLITLDDQSFFVPLVKITDHPRFRWRGLHIDVSRHWEPVEVIRRNLDIMAAMKMNVLHWHLSDDQGFRVESLAFPKLHKTASEGRYYTQKQIREIVTYARDRGIRVIPEFDMPGHTTAWLVAYPELASASGPFSIERSWGVFDPCMDPTKERLYVFLDAFIREMTRIFPDEYFHIGGDEVNGKQWNANPKIQAFKSRKHFKSNHELQAYFNQRLQKILQKYGKKMIGWDEILHPDLPKHVVVQSWRKKPSLTDILHQGFAGILSFGLYLDQMQTAAYHYDMEPGGKDAETLSADEKKRILGGEACMWAEMVNEYNIESRIWPRTAAIAERLWSPSDVRDVPDMYRRLEYAIRELEIQGLMPASNYAWMLQRMTAEPSIPSLKTLAGLLKPVGLGPRQRAQKYYSDTPLNRLADIIPPESDAARRFGDLVNQSLAASSAMTANLAQMRELLLCWQTSARQVRPALQQSFLLKEILPIAESVTEISSLGMDALNFLETRDKPPADWTEKAMRLLEKAEKQQAEMQLAIVPHVRRLVEAVN